MRRKKFDKKSWHNPPKHKTFRFTNRWHPREFAYDFFRHRETKNFRRKTLYFPLLLIHKPLGYQNFSETKHRNVRLRNVSVLRNKIISTEKFDSSARLLNHKFIRYRKLSQTQHRRVPLQSFPVLREKKKSTKYRDITLWSIKIFVTRI